MHQQDQYQDGAANFKVAPEQEDDRQQHSYQSNTTQRLSQDNEAEDSIKREIFSYHQSIVGEEFLMEASDKKITEDLLNIESEGRLVFLLLFLSS